ncbi:hypothetical protein N5P37_011385 [Trichoderma harzianum]|nr:hypothetical protein N5P37_011385 [Trichoderma harzianum]
MFYFSHTEIGVNTEMFNHEHGVASACRSIADLIQVVTTSTSPVIAASGRSALVVKEPGNTVVLKGPEAAPGTMWGVASPLLFTMPAFRLAASTPCTMIPRMLVSSPIYMSTERIIINSKVAEEFCKALLLTLKDFSDTQGWDETQLVSDVAVINNKKLITDALSKGAQLLADDMGHGI